MCFICKSGFNTSSCICTYFKRLSFYNQQRCGFRREAKRPDTKKGTASEETKASPSEVVTPRPPPPPRVSRPTLFKPLMFTVGVCTPISLLLQWFTLCLNCCENIQLWVNAVCDSMVVLDIDVMSVYRLLLWCGGHSAIWDPEVKSSDWKRCRGVKKVHTGEVWTVQTAVSLLHCW